MFLHVRTIAFLCMLYVMTSMAYADSTNNKNSTSNAKTVANNVVAGGAMGVTGIGAMQAMSGKAEQSEDAEAEANMKAYIQTFRCDYGQGKNIQGGDKQIEVPGASVLLNLRTEYLELAANLKQRKESLEMTPGIESDVILSAADTDLYDNAATGNTGGKYASTYRALMDENSSDAMQLKKQKEQSAAKIKSGGNMVVAGVAVGVVGNALVTAAGNGKLKNVLSGVGGGSGGKSANGNGSGLGAILGGGSGNGATPQQSAGGGDDELDAQISRAQAAYNTLQSDISSQAEDLYNQILTVQSDADSAGIDDGFINTIKNAKENAEGKKANIESLVGEALTQVEEAKNLEMPTLDLSGCPDNVAEPEQPDPYDSDYEPDYSNCSEGSDDYESCKSSAETVAKQKYAKAETKYNNDLKKYQDAKAKCEATTKQTYEKDKKEIIAKAKKYADEAEGRVKRAQVELAAMKTALSNANTAKSSGIAKQEKEAREAEAAAKKDQEQAAQIKSFSETAAKYADSARTYSDDAKQISIDADLAVATISESEESVRDVIENLVEDIKNDVSAADSAASDADSKKSEAASARDVSKAQAAAEEAKRQEELALKYKQSAEQKLQRLNNIKQEAQKRFDEEQKNSLEDSEET